MSQIEARGGKIGWPLFPRSRCLAMSKAKTLKEVVTGGRILAGQHSLYWQRKRTSSTIDTCQPAP